VVALRESDWIPWIGFDSAGSIQSVENGQPWQGEFLQNRMIP
jgi:hypothetical protein